MNKVIGSALIFTGALVIYGGLTGRLPAMLAAIFKPTDLVTSTSGKPTGGVNVGHPVSNAKALTKSGTRGIIDSIPVAGWVYEALR